MKKNFTTKKKPLISLNIKKPASILMILLLMISALSFIGINFVQATTTSYTFGNTSVGSITNYFVTDRDASRFQLLQSGSMQSITVYFASSGFNAKTAIYKDNNGVPSALLAQSNSQAVTKIGWNTFTISQTSLQPGYYWLCVVSSNPSSIGAMTPTSTNSHVWKTSTYSEDYPSTFGTANGYEKTVTSIYATYTVTPSASTPTTSPVPTPTATPTTTPSSATNLEPIPSAWSRATNGMYLSVGGVGNVVLDYNVLFNGNPSIRIDPKSYNEEANGKSLSIKPGDHIVYKVWVKTSSSALGETSRGARIGIDFYGSNGRIIGVNSPDGQTWTPDKGWPENENQNFVAWGTSNWKQLVIDFVVPNTYPADYWANYPLGANVKPVSIIPWLQVCSSVDGGQAWFANVEFYINP